MAFQVHHHYLNTASRTMQSRLRKRGVNGKWCYTHTIRKQVRSCSPFNNFIREANALLILGRPPDDRGQDSANAPRLHQPPFSGEPQPLSGLQDEEVLHAQQPVLSARHLQGPLTQEVQGEKLRVKTTAGLGLDTWHHSRKNNVVYPCIHNC